jgi:hypothetical protein
VKSAINSVKPGLYERQAVREALNVDDLMQRFMKSKKRSMCSTTMSAESHGSNSLSYL